MQFDWSAIWPAIPLLLEGAKMTLWISVLGLVGGIDYRSGGRFRPHLRRLDCKPHRTGFHRSDPRHPHCGAGHVSSTSPCRWPSPDLRIDPFSAAVVTIMINSGAYIAEITRGAVLSIHKGFSEAGLALGLSRRETIRHVILPLALRRMLPPLGNQLDHQHQRHLAVYRYRRGRTDPSAARKSSPGNFRALEIWSAVAVVYLIITLVLSFVLRRLERRMKIL